MTQHLTIIEDVLGPPEAWTRVECDDVRAEIMARFAAWPENAALYHGSIAEDRDVTPLDAADMEALGTAPGPFYMVLRPAEPISLSTIITNIAISLLLSAISYLLLPNNGGAQGQRGRSSSNELSGRQNTGRPLQRIPDIFGEVRCTPDLLGLPIRVFEDGREVEYAYMCASRGSLAISDVRDDTTLVSEIDGASVEFYGPDTSPLSGDPAELTIGDAITQALVDARASTAINGQILYAPNYKSVDLAALPDGGGGSGVGVYFYEPVSLRARIQAPSDDDLLRWTRYFEAGDEITITGATYTDGVTTVDLDGVYEVESLGDSGRDLWLVDPAAVNSDWNLLGAFSSDRTGLIEPLIEVDMERAIGPFQLSVATMDGVWVNVVAQNGLFAINANGAQERLDVDLTITLTPTDSAGTPTGAAEDFNFTFEGAATTRSLLGMTCRCAPTFTGYCKVEVERTSETDVTNLKQIVDEIRVRDLYAVSPINQVDFGNVTTVYARTVATPAALGIKQRKLNFNAIRKVPIKQVDNTFSGLAASKEVDDIICAMALDSYIGGRTLAELDVARIYSEVEAARTYFDDDDAVRFGYTFDDDQVSFEEAANIVASAAFCTALRRGSKLELMLEKETTSSTLLANHRNKLPGSERRTIHMGKPSNHDGIEFNYVDSENFDAPAVYRIPVDGSATKPRKIDGTGIRSFKQAFWQAWREYNKLRYAYCTVEFTGLPEFAMCVARERILVADNVRPGTQDGEVRAQSGLTLTLSRAPTFDDGADYLIFLQLPSGVTEAIDITAGLTANQVVLASAPSESLSLDPANAVRALYWIVKDDDAREQAFLIAEKGQADEAGNVPITAMNYDPRYYEKDSVTPA